MKLLFLFQCLFILRPYFMLADDSNNLRGEREDSVNMRGRILSGFALEAALQNDRNNMVCSPISVLMPIGKLALGVSSTDHDIFRALGVGSSQVSSYFRNLISKLRSSEGISLHICSKLYLAKGKHIYAKFVHAAESTFGSAYDFLDFSDQQGSADAINNWVSTRTDGIIGHIIDPSDIKTESSVIIVNAVYFKAEWQHTFKYTLRNKDFYSPRGKKQIDFLHTNRYYKYVKAPPLEAEIIKIPFKNDNDAYMAIVLPLHENGLNSVLNNIKDNPHLLNEWLEQTRRTYTTICIPKFTIDSTMALRDLYTNLGLRSIFRLNSGIDGIVIDEQVFVSTAIHKAHIEVNDRYAEAAAASVVESVNIAMDISWFNADHPFLFYVIIQEEQVFSGIFTGV